MSNKTFTWWDSNGNPHTGPITYFRVPAGQKLGPAHSYLRDHTEGTSDRAPTEMSMVESPPVTAPLETE
jgi:hypothetical protein